MAKNSMSPRRWTGGLFLVIAALMVVLGFSVFAQGLKGVSFILYWLTCFAFTLSAASAALIDLVMLRRDAVREQRRLIEKAIEEVEGDQANDGTANRRQRD